MKKIILLYILIISYSSFAQDSLVSINKLWCTLNYSQIGEDEFTNVQSSYIKFQYDTIINTLYYKKMYTTTDSLMLEWDEIGYAREENKKTHIIKKGDSTENLFYDFNLTINDTIIIKNPFIINDSLKMFVTSIDSINIINEKRKVITLSYTEVWIEGVGSIRGFLYPYTNPPGTNKTLTCVLDKDELIYQNPNFNLCYYNTLTNISRDLNSISIVKVYPNPSKNVLKFVIKEGILNQPLNLTIFNCNGCLIYTETLSKKELLIDISNFEEGIYFYSLISNDSKINTNGKFIKF